MTPVGVDIGETALATVCYRDERDSPATPEGRAKETVAVAKQLDILGDKTEDDSDVDCSGIIP